MDSICDKCILFLKDKKQRGLQGKFRRKASKMLRYLHMNLVSLYRGRHRKSWTPRLLRSFRTMPRVGDFPDNEPRSASGLHLIQARSGAQCPYHAPKGFPK